jgi:hypothetical protein
MSDFSLSPRCKYDLRSSVILRWQIGRAHVW